MLHFELWLDFSWIGLRVAGDYFMLGLGVAQHGL